MSSIRQIVDPNGRYFSSDSFDRFGDDMCELLLSFLTFKDKIRFECVSKQWKRLVFNKQLVLSGEEIRDINRLLSEKVGQIFDIDSHPLKTLLKKCPNIKNIEFNRISINDSVLLAITENCKQLESIGFDVWDVSEDAISVLGETLGSHLKSIAFYGDQEHKQTLLMSYCLNLRSLVCDVLPLNTVLPHLTKIDLKLSSEPQISSFCDFVDNYHKQIKDITLHMSKHSFEKMTENLAQISRFSNLQRLNLELFGLSSNMQDLIVDELTKIGQNCNKLKSISLSIFLEFSLDFFKIFKRFSSVKQLSFYGTNCDLIDSEVDFNSKSTLKRLSINCKSVGEHFFSNATKFSPNIESFELKSDCNLTDNSLISMTSWKRLLSLKLLPSDQSQTHITDDSLIVDLVTDCPQLESIVFNFKVKISRQTIDKLIEVANQRRNKTLSFEYYFSDESDLELNRLSGIPRNLIIKNGIPFDSIDS